MQCWLTTQHAQRLPCSRSAFSRPPAPHPALLCLLCQMMETGGGRRDRDSGALFASRSKMTRVKNAVTPDNRGKSKAGLNGVGLSSGGGGGGGGGYQGGSSGGTVNNESGAKCAAGVIENVCLLGAPVGATSARWERVARVVHGRIINGYSKSDIILGLVFRAKSLSLSVSGIQKACLSRSVSSCCVRCVHAGFGTVPIGSRALQGYFPRLSLPCVCVCVVGCCFPPCVCCSFSIRGFLATRWICCQYFFCPRG